MTNVELEKAIKRLQRRLCCILENLPTGGGSTSTYIEATVGTPLADSYGLTVGSTVYTNVALLNKQVNVERNLFPLPNGPWNGNTYFTKVLTDNFLTFSDPLQIGDRIKITIL